MRRISDLTEQSLSDSLMKLPLNKGGGIRGEEEVPHSIIRPRNLLDRYTVIIKHQSSWPRSGSSPSSGSILAGIQPPPLNRANRKTEARSLPGISFSSFPSTTHSSIAPTPFLSLLLLDIVPVKRVFHPITLCSCGTNILARLTKGF